MSTDLLQSCSSDPAPTAACWREAILRQLFGLDCKLHQGASFQANWRSWDLGSVKLARMTLGGHSVLSEYRMARQFPHEHLYLKLVVRGRVDFEQFGLCTSVGSGGMVLLDPARPFSESFATPSELVLFMLPKRELQERGLGAEVQCPLVQFAGASADNAVLWHMFLGAWEHVENMSVSLRARLGAQMLELAGHLLESSRAGVPSRSAVVMLVRAKGHIHKHLGDPNLGAAEIAAAMRLSTRSINRLFAAEGISTMRYVWHCRLERACNILQEGARNNAGVEEVAWRCGFSDATHFSRSFKRRYGCSPREFRRGSVVQSTSAMAAV